MKTDILLEMILLFPKTEREAITTEELVNKYYKIMPWNNSSRRSQNSFIRNQLNDMEAMKLIDYLPRVRRPEDRIKRSEKYFMTDSSLLRYFMNSKVALNLIWANRVMTQLGPVFGLTEVDESARGARMNQDEKVLADRIRIVPDGIGRKDAEIDATVLLNCVSALEKNHTLLLDFGDRQVKASDRVQDGIERTILGLVAKDGTIYAITCFGNDDPPVHIAMHRIEKAVETGCRAYTRPNFKIDDYINCQHQLAHVLRDQESPITMVLKVVKEAMFHFRERPISSIYSEPVIEEPTPGDPRFTITITVPFTVQLPPFLWSHAGWVEVISPPALRTYVGERLLAAASYYKKDVKARFGP
jgi:hypothetical protein